jgi:hypothetical protein
MKKKGLNKKVVIGIAAVAVVLAVALIVLFMKKDTNDSSNNSNSLKNLFTESSLNDYNTLTLEYLNEEIDPLTYLKNSSNVTVSPKSVSLSVVGDTDVTFTIKGETVVCNFIVNDTQSPVITLTNDSVDVESLDGYDVSSNIVSVQDPVDGDLPKVDKEPTKFTNSTDGRMYETGWYTVSLYDKTVTISACDNHGNTSIKSYTINVTEQEEDSDEESSNHMYSYQLVDLSGIDTASNWELIDSSDWYYAACTYMSGKYSTVQEALDDVVAHEASNGNTTNVENDARIFCEKDSNGNVLYYQAGYEE